MERGQGETSTSGKGVVVARPRSYQEATFFFRVAPPTAPAEDRRFIYGVTFGATHVRHCPSSDANEAFVCPLVRNQPQIH